MNTTKKIENMQKERAHREKVEDKHVNGSFRVRWHSIWAGSHNIFSLSAGEIWSTEYIIQKSYNRKLYIDSGNRIEIEHQKKMPIFHGIYIKHGNRDCLTRISNVNYVWYKIKSETLIMYVVCMWLKIENDSVWRIEILQSTVIGHFRLCPWRSCNMNWKNWLILKPWQFTLDLESSKTSRFRFYCKFSISSQLYDHYRCLFATF